VATRAVKHTDAGIRVLLKGEERSVELASCGGVNAVSFLWTAELDNPD